MTPALPGLHHVTAITSDAQRNIDFYTGVLGLRFVKRTVNFDDPSSYHLYYGDEAGRPGTAMTFFVWPGGRRGRVGPPQTTVTQFAIPSGSLDFWKARLAAHGVDIQPIGDRFGDKGLAFQDPDAMSLELIVSADSGDKVSSKGPIPTEAAIQGFHGVTLTESRVEETAALLTNVMGFQMVSTLDGRTRFLARDARWAAVVDVIHAPETSRGMMGTGTVHHVAFRVLDDAQQKVWQSILQERGFDVSPVMNRCYFHSIYFREPGGILDRKSVV